MAHEHMFELLASGQAKPLLCQSLGRHDCSRLRPESEDAIPVSVPCRTPLAIWTIQAVMLHPTGRRSAWSTGMASTCLVLSQTITESLQSRAARPRHQVPVHAPSALACPA